MFVWIPRFSYTIGCLNSETECYGYRLNDGTDPDALSVTLPGAIDIKFIGINSKEDPGISNETPKYPTYVYKNIETREPSNWYTHPAFTFGIKELSGIWVGKFETSVDTTSTCYNSMSESNCYASLSSVSPRILPNISSLRYQSVYNQFETSKKFSESGNIYGIDSIKTDGHMMKNSEWAAVAYLSQSIYGKYGNKDYSGANKEIYKNDSSNKCYTGRSEGTAPTTSNYSWNGTHNYDVDKSGTGASTTGNIYGIYDMSGGAYENVMGNYNNTTSSSDFESSWFTKAENAKYYDKFTTTTPSTTKSKETMGQAYVETSGWYSDEGKSLSNTYSWITRGGVHGDSTAGIFCSENTFGTFSISSTSFRSVLVPISK